MGPNNGTIDAQDTTESLLNAIKSIPRVLDEKKASDMIPMFIYNTETAMKKFPDPKSHDLILKLASRKIHVQRSIFEREFNTWHELRETLISTFRKGSPIEELEEELDTLVLDSYDNLPNYYKLVKMLVRDITLVKCDTNDWKNIPQIIAETEKLGLESFIEGLPTAISVYLMLKQPKTVKEACELTHKRIKRMKHVENSATNVLNEKISSLEREIVQLKLTVEELTLELRQYKTPPEVPKQEIKAGKTTRAKCHRCKELGHFARDCPKKQKQDTHRCRSLGIETDMNDSRKFLFLMHEDASVDLIKETCLPEGTKYTNKQEMVVYNEKSLESVGKLTLTLDFGDFRVKKIFFVISKDSCMEIEDDGVLRQNFGQIVERNGELFFTYETMEGMVELQFGVDCPKKGKCGHYYTK